MSEQPQTTPTVDDGGPLVINIKQKKKRKYSRGLRDLQKSGRAMSKASSRVSRAVAKGIDAYRKASDKSARKRRDGALRDVGVNVAKGLSRTLRGVSRTPVSLAKALNQRGVRRGVRRQTRALARLSRSLGWR